MVNKLIFKTRWNDFKDNLKSQWNLSSEDIAKIDGNFDVALEIISRRSGTSEFELRERLTEVVPHYSDKSFEEGGTTFRMPDYEKEELSEQLKKISKQPLIRRTKSNEKYPI